jgi:hypothetical protein
MDTTPLDDSALFARIGELSAVSCALLIVRHAGDVVGVRDVNVLRDHVASGYRLGSITPDEITVAWLYDQGWQPVESVDDDDDPIQFTPQEEADMEATAEWYRQQRRE